MPEAYNIKVKICLVGDAQVGKTSLVRRYVMDFFDDDYIATLGTKISKKKLIIKKDNKEFNLTLSIWDVLGQKELKNIQKMAFQGSKGAIFVCDITREETLRSVLTWIADVKKVTGEIPFVLIANKCDLTDDYSFSEKDIEAYSSQLNAPYFMTSAKFGDNVIRMFYKIGDLIIDTIFLQDSNQISNGVKLANIA